MAQSQQAEGRWLDEKDPNNTIDSFDEKSRKFMLKIGSQVVAVGRLVFNQHYTEAEHASLVKLPEYVKKSSFIEASRFATHPEFRGGNLFPALIQQIMKVALENNISWVVSNCEDSLVNIYLRFGVATKESFYTSFMEEKRLNLLISILDTYFVNVFSIILVNYISRYVRN